MLKRHCANCRYSISVCYLSGRRGLTCRKNRPVMEQETKVECKGWKPVLTMYDPFLQRDVRMNREDRRKRGLR